MNSKFQKLYKKIISQQRQSKNILPDILQDLFKRLESYRYGVLYSDGQFIIDQKEMWNRDYRKILVQTPEQMDQNRGGMCHDASVYLDRFCTEYHIKHWVVYISSNEPPKYPTHSFLIIFNDRSQKFIVCDLFSTKQGYYSEEFSTLDEAINYRVYSWCKSDNNGSKNIQIIINKHTPGEPGFLTDWWKKLGTEYE